MVAFYKYTLELIRFMSGLSSKSHSMSKFTSHVKPKVSDALLNRCTWLPWLNLNKVLFHVFERLNEASTHRHGRKHRAFGVTAKVVPVTLTHRAFLRYNINNNGTDVRSHCHHSWWALMCPPLRAHIWRNSPPGAPEILCSLNGMGTLSNGRTNSQPQNILPAVIVITGAEASQELIYSWYSQWDELNIYCACVIHGKMVKGKCVMNSYWLLLHWFWCKSPGIHFKESLQFSVYHTHTAYLTFAPMKLH